MAQFKTPDQLADNFEDDDIYNEWENSILTESRRNSQPFKMATRMSDAPLKKIDDDFKNRFYGLGHDRELSDRVLNHIQKYENLADRFGGDIESISDARGGQMAGLEYRLKRPESLLRKIKAEIDEKRNAGNANYGVDDAFNDMRDTARYTIVFDENNFEKNIYDAINDMKGKGYNLVKFKNYFQDNSPYKGLNTVFSDKDGNMFELQFHLPRSLKTKEGIDADVINKTLMLDKRNLNSHDYYETTRVLENKIMNGVATPREKRLYDILMKKSVDRWRDIPSYDLRYE